MAEGVALHVSGVVSARDYETNQFDLDVCPPCIKLLKIKKQYDANFVDSGNVLQVLRQQTAQEYAHHVSVDVEANLLAELDEDAYQEAKLCDADRILHQYLLPMAYPWSENHYYSDVIKTFPRDIDEMPDILGMEDYSHAPFENGLFGYGKFEVGKSTKAVPSSDGRRAATRRMEDPGVIELTVINDSHDATPAASYLATPAKNVQQGAGGKKNGQDEVSPRRSSRKRKSAPLDDHERRESKPHHVLDYFQRLQESKKTKTNHAAANVQKKFVSVRFGSVSSRSSIIDSDIQPWGGSDFTNGAFGTDSSNKTGPMLVKVQLPMEVQAGRALIIPTAEENAKKLGSYDMRYGMSSADTVQKPSNRSRRQATGRTRLMWTKAHLGGRASNDCHSSRHRLAYSTILTSDRVDISLYRRPREVVLAVRVNGVRLTQKRSDSTTPKAVMDRPFGNDDETVAAASGLGIKAISDAVVAACGTVSATKSRKKRAAIPQQPDDSEPSRGEPICFLQSEELLQNLLRARKAEAAAAKRSAKTDIPKAGTAAHIPISNIADFIHPTLECLPSADGLVRIVCTISGDMKPRWVPAILELDSDETKPAKCSVCFFADSTESVEACITCGVRVHLSCCSDKGTRRAGGSSWACASCSSTRGEDSPSQQSSNHRKRKSKTPHRFRDDDKGGSAMVDPVKQNASSLQCQLCPHSGGAMSPLLESGGYVHEVCRIWTRVEQQQHSEKLDEITRNPLLNCLRMLCALCGSRTVDVESNEIVRCAASGCQVRFHPMCSLLASKIATSEAAQSEMPSDKLERMNILDSQLCKQYTLTMMKCTVGDEEEFKTTILPVAFCGLHNPIRDTSLYGCYPCGGLIGDTMRIPSLNLS